MERLSQELEFQEGMLADQLREIKKARAEQRRQVETILQSIIPNPIENTLTRDQARMLRLYNTYPGQLKENERLEAQKISNYIQRLRSGGCYNLSSQQERELGESGRLFSFIIPGTVLTLCIDIAFPIQKELVNYAFKMVDIYIDSPEGEKYRYPFDDAISQAYLDRLISLGVDPSVYPQMRFPNLEDTQIEIENLTLQLNPNLFL